MEALSPQQLAEVRSAMSGRVQEGLATSDQQLRCLPAYLRPPSTALRGQAIVVDAGGTNMRAALVEWTEEGPKVVQGPRGGILPDGRTRPVDAKEFFTSQADLVAQLGAPRGLPLGYCFSYPAEVIPSGDARLLYWTKAIKISGVEGTLVGQALADAIGAVPRVKVLNDTVAALMGGSALAQGKYAHTIGLIVGTGNNMATFLEERQIEKLGSASETRMAVNFESGNFHPPHLTAWDEEVDAASDNPGQQRFEKAVSGYYLPFLFERACPGLAGFDPLKGSSQLEEILSQSSSQPAKAAARWVLDRSADLVAASLAGVADFFPDGNLAVQAEGGLFWKTPNYAQRVEATLRTLLGGSREFAITRAEDVNLIGAASAALAP